MKVAIRGFADETRASIEVFERMAPLVAPVIEQAFGRRDLCIMTTRIAIEVAAYFGVKASPAPVQVIAYNAAYARHRANHFADVDPDRPSEWGDNSWSVGIGCGKPPDPDNPSWDGHLIALADGWFADFAIQQAERPQHNIITGPAVVGPYRGMSGWKAIEKESGTVIEYRRTRDNSWRNAPDWRDAARRRPLVARLIRALKAVQT